MTAESVLMDLIKFKNKNENVSDKWSVAVLLMLQVCKKPLHDVPLEGAI